MIKGKLNEYCTQNPRTTEILGVLTIFLLGALDYETGYELSISIFYLAPIALVAWYCGRKSGFLVALISSAVWLLADFLAGHLFEYAFIPFWNASVRLGFFCIVVGLLSSLKVIHEDQIKMYKDLRESMDNVKVLSGLIPICAWCKRIRNDDGYMQQVEAYITEHSGATFTHGMCQECKEKELAKLKQNRK